MESKSTLKNSIIIRGTISDIQPHTKTSNGEIKKFFVNSQRYSGKVDTIPVLANESLIQKIIANHQVVEIHGCVSSCSLYYTQNGEKLYVNNKLGLHTADGQVIIPYNQNPKLFDDEIYYAIKNTKTIKTKLLIRILADKVVKEVDDPFKNTVTIDGFVCRKRGILTTGISHKKRLDYTIGTRNDHIPAVAWSNAAVLIDSLKNGTKITLQDARLESREFQKQGDDTVQTAVELMGGKVLVMK